MGSDGIRKNGTLICAPLMGDSVDRMLIDMSKAKSSGADLVEVRLDSLKSFDPRRDIEILIQRCPLPTLFTYRPKWEGGLYDGDENSRLDALRLAMELGADYIDVELQVAQEFNSSMNGKKHGKCKVIVSSHNYQNTPSSEDLGNLVAIIQAAGADIVKIATTALDITDVARVFQITVHSQVPIIAMVMGERGLMSRILCPKFGGYLTFGTLESGVVSAPGQPTISDLVKLYNFRQIGPDTKVFGIIGNPVSHSKSPILYNEAFKQVGFDGVYIHLLVDNIAKFFQTYSSTDFAGFSCTIPHKEAALKCCDEVDPVAKSIGAVNCIIRKSSDGKLFGCNTDFVGAITAIEDALRGSGRASGTIGSPLAGKLFVVIGAGGAGKALAYGAKEKGARVVIANRTYERAKEIADAIGGDALSLADLEDFHPEDGMILANTTSIGMQPKVDETPVSKRALSSYDLVFDAVYTPKITRLLREAEESGAIIVTGVEHGQKSDWIMHEYRLDETTNDASANNLAVVVDSATEEGWVVCRVFKKKNYNKALESPQYCSSSTSIRTHLRNMSATNDGVLDQILHYMGRSCKQEINTNNIYLPSMNATIDSLEDRFTHLPRLENHHDNSPFVQDNDTDNNNFPDTNPREGLSDWVALDRLVASQLNGQDDTTSKNLYPDDDDDFSFPVDNDGLQVSNMPSNRLSQPSPQGYGSEIDLWSFVTQSSPSSSSSDPLGHLSV